MASEAKRPKYDVGVEDRLKDFLQWCDDVGLELSKKVYVTHKGTVAAYGMLAKDDIEEGEVLFTVPREAILHQGSSKVAHVLDKEKETLKSGSTWVPLLMSLLHECVSPQSRWRPYLSLWNGFKKLDQPMFWSKDERDLLLKGTGIPNAVNTDLDKMDKEYTNVIYPLINKYPEYWPPHMISAELYMQMVAFVMAYSFQEPNEEEEEEDEDDDDEEQEAAPNPPMMVPMADMLNHVANHNANLEFTPDSLKMISVRPISKGEEVFNTYGEMANWQLLHMYGFTEPFPSNSNDTVDVAVGNFYKAAKDFRSDLELPLLEEKWDMLNQKEGNAIIFGKHGCLTDTSLHTVLKVLCMSKEEFSHFKEDEGWEEDDEEEIDEAFSNEGFPSLKAIWKKLIHGAAKLTLHCYNDKELVREEDPDMIDNKEAFEKLNSRQQRAFHVRYGQKNILYKLLELTKP